ncbi:LOW QUALITY PROTEIN: protein SINE1-like [Dioscorea cayenensis subsp. rotundata]|uniref:LOW QUALITY PROTEIN: protein SINE1-like n=1 Tax=Dioscorea cayennensis subsp. rotundata TaxID=55577 RepID=A0AB40CPD8_DIOCR|nr:LOW QUALITY PROTEIN: protein SINE1-like [Dioscorea cayenensis subsp. rotundata]
MGRNLSPVLRRELENLDKDPDSRRSAMKALKTYVKDLDAKAIPQFLTQVSETKEPGSSSGEYTISLYEVLARVHGRNIVPQIDNIMSTIIRTLSSSAGSFPLHQACSKLFPAVARYGIDPSTSETEKTRIIGSLCKPLADVLMSSIESAASGAALCLKALVESDNWRFASDEMVNDVCLKVACALEEKHTQTNAHMGLAMSLFKHNALIAEAYARSLVRSGLQILSVGVKESNSQRRLSAIQMINFLLKCVDSRSVASELSKVVVVLERCQNDRMPFVRGAAFEALQTAKTIIAQKGSRHEVSSSPIVDSNFRYKGRKWTLDVRDDIDSKSNGFPAEFGSPDTRTVDSFLEHDTSVDSPLSIGQASCNFDYARRANRRLWNNDNWGVDVSLRDGLFHNGASDFEISKTYSDQLSNADLSEMQEEQSDTFSGFIQVNSANGAKRGTSPSPQRARPVLSVDDVKIYSTPRKLVRSLQNSDTADSEGHNKPQIGSVATPTSGETVSNPATVTNRSISFQIQNYETNRMRNRQNMQMTSKSKQSP